ncbi:MAG: cbb3-type cytochrome c oxidase subunit 3 [Gemmatimonadota bacterium]
MNPLIQEAAGSVELGWLLGVMTVVFFAFFLAWTYWAFAPSHRRRMEEYARMPFDEGGE